MSKALVRSTSLVSAMTFISRILGFVRDMLVAQVFGVSAAVDAFNVAFKIPNFMRGLFAEGSFSQAFVPVLSEYRQTKTPIEVRHFISHMSGVLGFVLLIVTILGIVGAKGVVSVFAPGLDPYRFMWATEMLRVTFPYLMLISLTAFTAAILNSYGKFGVPSFTPALLNVCLITTAFGITKYFELPIEAQAWGVLLAGFVQFFFQLPFLHRLGFLTWPRFNWRDPGVQKVLKLMLPALFGASVGQISLLLNTIFASFLPIGSVTWLYFSDRLAYFPLGVFGVALATVVLPQLSRHHAANSHANFASTLEWGVRCNLLIGMPAAVGMLVLSAPLIISLFDYGKFTAHDVFMTQRSVIAYSIGLPAFMLVKVLSSAFYARQNIKTPVRIAMAALVFNMILNAAFIFPLAHAGLALATSLSSWFNVGLLVWMLRCHEVNSSPQDRWKFYLRLITANMIFAMFLYWAMGDVNNWLAWHWSQRFLHICIVGFSGIAVYMASLYLMGVRLKDFKSTRI